MYWMGSGSADLTCPCVTFSSTAYIQIVTSLTLILKSVNESEM